MSGEGVTVDAQGNVYSAEVGTDGAPLAVRNHEMDRAHADLSLTCSALHGGPSPHATARLKIPAAYWELVLDGCCTARAICSAVANHTPGFDFIYAIS